MLERGNQELKEKPMVERGNQELNEKPMLERGNQELNEKPMLEKKKWGFSAALVFPLLLTCFFPTCSN
jgi:hypothetical protein